MLLYLRSDEIVRAAVRLLQGSGPLKSWSLELTSNILPDPLLQILKILLSSIQTADLLVAFRASMKRFSAGVVQERNERNGKNQVSTIQRTLPSLPFNGTDTWGQIQPPLAFPSLFFCEREKRREGWASATKYFAKFDWSVWDNGNGMWR